MPLAISPARRAMPAMSLATPILHSLNPPPKHVYGVHPLSGLRLTNTRRKRATVYPWARVEAEDWPNASLRLRVHVCPLFRALQFILVI